MLVFNEVQYNPAPGQPEFIELRSLSGVDVSIAGWRIEGGVDFTFPAGTVMPGGGYIVLSGTAGAISGALGTFSGVLDNAGETLRLRNLNGRIMDEVEYDNGDDWPAGADGTGASLARRSASAAPGPNAWLASTKLGGTPRAKNFPDASDPATVTTLIALSAAWKYRDNNEAQPTGWPAAAFDDTAWPSGGALLYAGSPNLTGAGEALHGYWPLAEASGSVAPNLAAGGTVGTLFAGATWVSDSTRGQVLNVDGTDGYVSAGLLPQMTLSNNFTWSFWANSVQTGGNVIVGNRFSPSGAEWSPREFIKFTPDAFQYDRNSVEIVDYADIPIGTWLHHAMVKQGTTLTYYRNGVVGGSRTIGGGQNNAQPFYFGGDKTNENWTGRLDDVAVWTRALPASSITGLANGSLTPLTAPTASPGGTLTTALAQGPVTHYFRRAFTFSGAKERTTLTLQHLLDDGAVIYLNGSEVLRVNMPAGAIGHGTPASSEVTSSSLSPTVVIPSDALVNGTNVLAVEVHQHPANSDMVFGATLVSSEAPAVLQPSALVFNEIAAAGDPAFFVELRNTSGGPVDTAGWLVKATTGQSAAVPAQNLAPGGLLVLDLAALGFTPQDGVRLSLLAPGGTELRDAREVTPRRRGLTADGRWAYPTSATPGAANIVTVSDAIVINEIFYHAPGASLEQWVELHNRSAAPVDVSHWEFSDGISYQFPASTAPIPPGGFAVVAWNPVAFQTLHGFTPSGPFMGSLSGKGETLTLRDASGNVADQVTYADDGRWSQWADGGGSSLELRDPRSDNSKGEAWDASDESSQSSWTTISAGTYQALATNPNSPDPTHYNEFVFGLLDSGEFLIDDISVRDKGTVAAPTDIGLIQNGGFESGAATAWRIIGTHVGTVITDPTTGSGKVLKISASGATEHMHNHAETTLKNGAAYVAIDPTHFYDITFRAKWLRGSNRLHTRLWHNRIPRQTPLNMPTTGGTPGAVNSVAVANIGPAFEALAHSPVVPAASQPATVSIRVADPDGVGSVQLFTSVNGAGFTSAAMATSGDGVYSATISGKAAGALVHFYVRATDSLGVVSFFPAAGAGARAMIPWDDSRAQLTLASGAKPHNIRVVLPAADATELYKPENLMSDAARPCTVIVNEREVYYRAGVRLKSSEHGRITDSRCGYTLEFPSDDLFFGAHDTISVDRSGGTVTGQKEILLKRLENTAGGITASEDDIVRVISAVGTVPPGQFTGANITGAAILSRTRLDREFLDAQWPNGGDGSQHKYERIYPLTQTIHPTTRGISTFFGATPPTDANVLSSPSVEFLKIPQSSPGPNGGVAVTGLGADKENYRWYWLLQNGREADDYSGITNVVGAIGQASGSAAFNTQVAQYIDVSAWLRATVPATLYGVTDNYLGTGGGGHNSLIQILPGQKAVLLPWDCDFLNQGDSTTVLTAGGDVSKFIANPVWKRLFFGHVLDLLNRSFNTSYMNTWATHYSRFGTDDMTAQVSAYLAPRAAHAMNVINGSVAGHPFVPFVTFARTSAATMTVSTPFAPVSGRGWINVAEIRLQGSTEPLDVTWTGENTWTLQLPISAGTKTYTLVAFSPTGAQLGTATVTVTGSGGVFPASAGTLVVSELHYNPPGSSDLAEFIELWNITGATLDLGGCHFDEENAQGIAYTFPAGVQVPPGGRILVVRDRVAFGGAYPAAGPLAPNQFTGALDNAGETLVLYAASGLEIFRFTYSDSLAGTDGDGRSLVRVLSATNPNPNTLVWRASIAAGGNPGATDAVPFSGAPLGDGDLDGLASLLEYAGGTSDGEPTPQPLSLSRDAQGIRYVTFPHALGTDDAMLTIEAAPGAGGTWAPASVLPAGSTQAGGLTMETWRVSPPLGSTAFFIRLNATPR